jgi:hypothetical protein
MVPIWVPKMRKIGKEKRKKKAEKVERKRMMVQ